MAYWEKKNKTDDYYRYDGGNAWGTGIYSDDSDLGVAAVHAGILKVGETKTVKITILPGGCFFLP